jgi:phosphoesterase RecJ-like protein
MELDSTGRVATIMVDRRMAAESGGTYEDTEGLVNLPLTVKSIEAVVFLKEIDENEWRISLRSKGQVDVNAVASEFGGGGHRNASGCSAVGPVDEVKVIFQQKLLAQIDADHRATPV